MSLMAAIAVNNKKKSISNTDIGMLNPYGLSNTAKPTKKMLPPVTA